MTAPVALVDVERFREVVAHRLGLHLDDTKVEFLGEVVRRRLGATRLDVDSYLHTVDSDCDDAELGALATELTVPETYFFRNIDQFHACADVAIPERLKARGSGSPLRVLSAGCASGEEAYTLAIILRELLEPQQSASVLAIDLNPAALRKAQRGRYSPWSLRETPPAVQERWFSTDVRTVVLDDTIRADVQFAQRNLAADDPGLWAHESYDIVFCRNVIMYFTPETARAVVARIAGSLAPGGYLFLGHAETLRGLSQDFHLCHTHGTFYYQRKLDDGAPPTAAHRPARAANGRAPREWDAETWVDAIQSASERVARLVPATPESRDRSVAPDEPADANRWSLGAALELVRAERFGAALDVVETLPTDAAADPDVVLLHSVLLTHAGRLDEADAACRRLLAISELNAGAHYVLALVCESRGDIAGAADHDHMAAYVDPCFAMPRVHLGLLARRAGDRAAVRRELTAAVGLLEHEDPSRLLLFGGGFSRSTLVALCHAELGTGAAES